MLTERIERIEDKVDKILEIVNQDKIDISRNTYCLFGNGQKGIVKRVEELEETTEVHKRYFWAVSFLMIVLQTFGFNFKALLKK